MFELIYCSTAKSGLTQTDVSNILDTSRKFNSENDITGCLLFHNNEFVQLLEGNKKIIQDLFSSIKKDKRHSTIRLLNQSEKTERTFPNWNMAYHRFDSNDQDKSDFVKNLMLFSELANKPTLGINVFWTKAKHILSN